MQRGSHVMHSWDPLHIMLDIHDAQIIIRTPWSAGDRTITPQTVSSSSCSRLQLSSIPWYSRLVASRYDVTLTETFPLPHHRPVELLSTRQAGQLPQCERAQSQNLMQLILKRFNASPSQLLTTIQEGFPIDRASFIFQWIISVQVWLHGPAIGRSFYITKLYSAIHRDAAAFVGAQWNSEASDW